ncbi:MAG: protein kinase, partial [Gemmataceae bacterium]|nr:protein kinase [Gemmataceae bacterium]
MPGPRAGSTPAAWHEDDPGVVDDLIARVKKAAAANAPPTAPSYDADPTGEHAAYEPLEDTVIAGRYRLVQPIGEGGMGAVWVAEQSEPVRRRVAIKLIKPGMDSKEVLARFNAERQALAVMDHPNIAKVFDGGMTDRRRPYFVMELIRGSPLTRYCDDNKLNVRERLELFVSVCQAV